MNNIGAINFVVVGKSGVGKSSLINYFFDSNIAKAGAGKPVTEKKFEIFSYNLGNQNFNIYDSWGIEGGKTDEWIEYFEGFLKERKGKDVFKWIHTAIYCISGESNRIEEYDKKIINLLIKEKLNPVIVVTKIDSDKSNLFLNAVEHEFSKCKIVGVCNVTQSIGLGSAKRTVSKFGIENLKEAVLECSLEVFISRFELIREEIIKTTKENVPHALLPRVDKIIDKSYSDVFGVLLLADFNLVLEKIEKEIFNYNKETTDIIEKVFTDASMLFSQMLKSNESGVDLQDFADRYQKNKGEDNLRNAFLASSLSRLNIEDFRIDLFNAKNIFNLSKLILGGFYALACMFFNYGVLEKKLLKLKVRKQILDIYK